MQLRTLHDLCHKMQDYGLQVDNVSLNTRGKLVRCSTIEKPRKKNGWYVIYVNGDFTTAIYGDYQKAEHGIKWHNKDKLSQCERRLCRDNYKAAQMQLEHDKNNKLANLRVNYAKNVRPLTDSHPYLDAKGISDWLTMSMIDPLGIMPRGDLVVPIRNMTGKLMGYQLISDNGDKKFVSGTQKKGNFYTITSQTSSLAKSDRVFIAEGLATGVAIYLGINALLNSTACAVLVAFDVGNIVNVCLSVWRHYPDKYITLISDNDCANDKNSGVGACKAIIAQYTTIKNIDMFVPEIVC